MTSSRLPGVVAGRPGGRRVVLVLITLVASLAAFPWHGVQALRKDPAAPPATVRNGAAHGLRLGLDLEGGLHLVLKVQTADALRAETQDALDRVRDEARARGVTLPLIAPAGPGSF